MVRIFELTPVVPTIVTITADEKSTSKAPARKETKKEKKKEKKKVKKESIETRLE